MVQPVAIPPGRHVHRQTIQRARSILRRTFEFHSYGNRKRLSEPPRSHSTNLIDAMAVHTVERSSRHSFFTTENDLSVTARDGDECLLHPFSKLECSVGGR